MVSKIVLVGFVAVTVLLFVVAQDDMAGQTYNSDTPALQAPILVRLCFRNVMIVRQAKLHFNECKRVRFLSKKGSFCDKGLDWPMKTGEL